MNELLGFLVDNLAFLYLDYGARFVDSETHNGNAFVVLDVGNLQIRLVRDRGQLFMDFRYVGRSRKSPWFSYGVVREFLTGNAGGSEELTEKDCRFVRERFTEILEAFSAKKWRRTAKALSVCEKRRARRLFG